MACVASCRGLLLRRLARQLILVPLLAPLNSRCRNTHASVQQQRAVRRLGGVLSSSLRECAVAQTLLHRSRYTSSPAARAAARSKQQQRQREHARAAGAPACCPAARVLAPAAAPQLPTRTCGTCHDQEPAHAPCPRAACRARRRHAARRACAPRCRRWAPRCAAPPPRSWLPLRRATLRPGATLHTSPPSAGGALTPWPWCAACCVAQPASAQLALLPRLVSSPAAAHR